MADDYTSSYDDYLNAKDSLLNTRIGENTTVQDLLDIIANSGAFDFTGSISGKDTQDIASGFGTQEDGTQSTIITDIINARFDTSSKQILDTFTFGTSGAIQIGAYVNGVSGDIRITPNGILARNKNNATTFSLDGTTGNATYAGTVTAAQVVAGTFTGFTFQTAASGQRVVISGADNSLRFYDTVGQVIGIGTDAGWAIKVSATSGTASGLQFTSSETSGSGYTYTNSATLTGSANSIALTGASNTAAGLRIDNDGASGAYGILLDLTNASAGMYIGNSGSADSIIIVQSGNGNPLDITNSGSGSTFLVDKSTSGNVLDVTNSGSGYDIYLTHSNNGASPIYINHTASATANPSLDIRRTASAGACVYIEQDCNSASAAYGIDIDIANAGAGLEHAFRFLGSEQNITAAGNSGFVSNSKGTLTLVGFIRVYASGGTYYMPYGTVA